METIIGRITRLSSRARLFVRGCLSQISCEHERVYRRLAERIGIVSLNPSQLNGKADDDGAEKEFVIYLMFLGESGLRSVNHDSVSLINLMGLMKETSIVSFCKIYNNFYKFFYRDIIQRKLSITAGFNRPHYHLEHISFI